jgi:CheY-like chemotaxis protein
MPVMDGYETCKRLKNLMSTKEISPLYIVAVTADVTPSNIEKCKETGFDEIVSKPVSRRVLMRVLKTYLNG